MWGRPVAENIIPPGQSGTGFFIPRDNLLETWLNAFHRINVIFSVFLPSTIGDTIQPVPQCPMGQAFDAARDDESDLNPNCFRTIQGDLTLRGFFFANSEKHSVR